MLPCPAIFGRGDGYELPSSPNGSRSLQSASAVNVNRVTFGRICSCYTRDKRARDSQLLSYGELRIGIEIAGTVGTGRNRNGRQGERGG